jgi:hypothetical protein
MGTRARVGAWVALILSVAACGGGEGNEDNVQRDEARATPVPDTAAGGTTWSALYRDLFGSSAAASCAGTSVCHGSASASGAIGSHGYVCADAKGCRASMLSNEAALVQPSDATAPEKSTLIQVLRRQSSGGVLVGSMPKRSQFVFTNEQLARIETWIRNGAPDD